MVSVVEIVNFELSVLTAIGQLLILLGILVIVNDWKKLKKGLRENSVLISFIIALVATLGSLFYSEVAGYVPCKMCWFQRIFMYPQVFLLGVALWKKDKGAKAYAIVLSLIGAIIAGFHYMLQRGWLGEGVSCGVIGYSESCSQIFTMNFGYITIPLMAFTAFLMIIVFSSISKVKEEKGS